MTKIIRARNVQTVRNIKSKPSSHILGPRSELLVLGLRSLIPGHRFCFVDLKSQALGPESWILVSRFWVVGPKSRVLGYRSWFFGSGSVIIRKCDKKLLKNVIGITKCDRKLLQSVTGITKCGNCYKVRRNTSNKDDIYGPRS